ncbi:MAG: hypothetical protein R3B13_24395 [Polyangiaceae bacterium]
MLVPGRPERRFERRSDTLLALSRLLDAARRDGGLEALAVADSTGMLVAGAGFWRTCEELAALSPLHQATAAANDVVPTRLDVIARRTQVRRLSIDGVEVLLSGIGGEDRQEAALARAAEGCERILAQPRRSRV